MAFISVLSCCDHAQQKCWLAFILSVIGI